MPIDRPPDARPVDPARLSAVIDAVTAATVTTFEELCQTSIVPGEPYLSRIIPIVDAVTAEITLRRAVPGRLVLAYPRQVLGVLASRYLPGEAITPEIADDAAGEFANVIAGQIKTMLHGTPYHFHLSTPHVGVTASSATEAPDFLVLTFDCDAGIFAVHVYLPLSGKVDRYPSPRRLPGG
jgi:CheY-specific phosphatase CheX